MVTECPSSDTEPLPNETIASVAVGTENFVNVDIAGGEVLFANVNEESDTPDNPTDDEQLPIEGGDDVQFPLSDDRRQLSPNFEADRLSILMEDFSGSFLDNLPPDITDNMTAPSIPTIVFHRIGQSLDQDVLEPSLQPESQQVAIHTDLGLEESLSAEEPPLRSSRMHCCIHLVVVTIFVVCLSMKLLVEESHVEDPKHFGLSHHVEIFVPTAVVDLTSTTQYPRNHPNSSADGDSLMNEFDSASLFNMMIQSFSNLDNSKIGLFLHRAHLFFSSFWFTEWIQNLVAKVCFIFSTFHFSSASAVYAFSILSLGIVSSCLLVMFISSASATQVPINAEYGRDTISTTDMSGVRLSEGVLCENEVTEKISRLEKQLNTATEENNALNEKLHLSEVELCFSIERIIALETLLRVSKDEVEELKKHLHISSATASEQIKILQDEYEVLAQSNLQKIERVNALKTLLKTSKDEVEDLKKHLHISNTTASEQIKKLQDEYEVLVQNASQSNLQSIRRVNALETLLKASKDEVEELQISNATASEQIKKMQDEYDVLFQNALQSNLQSIRRVKALETSLKASEDEVKELTEQLCNLEATAAETIKELQNDLRASNVDFTQSTQRVESLCRFLRRCQGELSRSGRSSRVALSSDTCWLLNSYDKSAYERLTIEDLKLIGNFLGLSGLSTLSGAKINLIGAVVLKYDSILRHLTMTELMQVLTVLNVHPSNYPQNDNLLKIIVEAGF